MQHQLGCLSLGFLILVAPAASSTGLKGRYAPGHDDHGPHENRPMPEGVKTNLHLNGNPSNGKLAGKKSPLLRVERHGLAEAHKHKDFTADSTTNVKNDPAALGSAMFFQMGSSQNPEHKVEKATEDDSASAIKVTKVTKTRLMRREPRIRSAGKDKDNALLAWAKDFFAVGASGASDDLNAADTLGENDVEANFGADTEGVWLLVCLASLLFFSCLMMYLSRFLCPLSSCMAPLRPKTKVDEAEINGGGKIDIADKEIKSDVPEPEPELMSFESVVESARAAEEKSLEKAAVGGVQELLSAVTCQPAERFDKCVDSSAIVADAIDSTQQAGNGIVGEHVLAISALTEEILERLEDENSGGYDCVLSRPLSFSQVVRLEATVLQSETSDILAPLSLQMCVLYQVTVSRPLHAGMPSVPVAFSSMNTAFQVAPCLQPELRVAVEGADVMLFDTVVGAFSYKGPFVAAAGHLQDYILTHRNTVPSGRWQTSSALRTDSTPLEFKECALLVGSRVTIVGELARGAGGSLVLNAACLDLPELRESPRVLVSDNYNLFRT